MSAVKILMVDDRRENLFALEVILRGQDYECIKASSGTEALLLLDTQDEYAIILMDVQMPMMDGFETVELIRKVERLKHIPIIFLTASMDSAVHVFKGYETGAVDYMIKPLSPEILRAKVAVFVDLFKKTNELLVQKAQLIELTSDVTAQKLLSTYSLSLIEASHDPLFAVSPVGKITDMNNASVKVTGLLREHLIGTDFFDYFTEPEKARELYKDVFTRGFVADIPLRFKHKDGKLTDVLFNGSVYKDDKGKVLGVVIVARDVTAQKRFENELIVAKSNAEGERQIAVAAVKSKQQFLSNMSHEIRTPMNAIIGFTKIVQKTNLDSKQKQYLNAIQVSGDALIVLIDDILDLAKVDSGKMTFEQVPFKMSVSIAAMLHLFETKIQEKNLEFVREYDQRIPNMLIGDPVRLHQIILNLVSNAVKFTNEGIISVSVALLAEDEDKVTIEFSVSDTGIGIAANELENIFENFQQATTDTLRLYGGTGLGLAIVKQLVELQNGSISMKSKINEGSVFSFRLDFSKTNVVEKPQLEMLESHPETKNIKILVVEDIPLNQLLMKTLLDDFGFENDVAENGKIAIEKLDNKAYDIVLMDLQMPEMNGFEATTYIRDVMKSAVPIIALTADVTTVDLAKCKSVGMNDYIAKPVDEKLLYSKIVGLVTKPLHAVEKMDQDLRKLKGKYTDLTHMNRFTKSNPKFIVEMISIYLQQTKPILLKMNQSLAESDWSGVQSAVHKLIPSFSIVGMSDEYENIAKVIQENASTRQHLNEMPELIARLERACGHACIELESRLESLDN